MFMAAERSSGSTGKKARTYTEFEQPMELPSSPAGSWTITPEIGGCGSGATSNGEGGQEHPQLHQALTLRKRQATRATLEAHLADLPVAVTVMEGMAAEDLHLLRSGQSGHQWRQRRRSLARHMSHQRWT